MRRVVLGLGLCLGLASAGLQAAEGEVTINADAPSQYTVVEGDTLWDIAGEFLEEPWLWPQVWQINPQIENPDLIYPGDVIELVYGADGSPMLRLSRSAPPELQTVRLSPRVRREAILSPIPAISLDDISAFLSKNTVLSEAEFEAAPHLLAAENGHTLIRDGDVVFARGQFDTSGGSEVGIYDIVRRGRDIADPDSGTVFGIEGLAVGTAELQSISGDKAILDVLESDQDIRAGDRFVPRRGEMIQSRYMPAPPDYALSAAIISIGTGREIGGLYDSLIINMGRFNGIEPGHILTIREPAQEIIDEFGEVSPWEEFKKAVGMESTQVLEFPGTNVGTALVYRVFDSTSMALVIRTKAAIKINDRVVTPE